VQSYSSVANQFAYDIPISVQKVYNVVFATQPLIPMNYNLWKLQHWDRDDSVAIPYSVTIWNRQILLAPRPSTSATTTTLTAAITSTTATTITVALGTAFKRGDYYRFIIDSEVIYATNATATTLTGCLRGMEGTTAAVHSNGSTVTERDIVYTGHVEPTDLFDTQDRTSIPEPDLVAYGAAIDLAPFVDAKDSIPFFEGKYNSKLVELESKYAVKYSSKFATIKSGAQILIEDNLVLRNPNNYPSNIVGS